MQFYYRAEFEDKKVFKIQRRDETNLKLHFTEVQHVFQEYTYKKITPCDVCREILRGETIGILLKSKWITLVLKGHSRQGLKCKLCKINVHSGKCQENAQRCQVRNWKNLNLNLNSTWFSWCFFSRLFII